MDFEGIVAQNSSLGHVFNLVHTVPPRDSTVLLLGETGTGKELIARAIHERSRRDQRPFVKLNCAAIPSGLRKVNSSVMSAAPLPARSPSVAKRRVVGTQTLREGAAVKRCCAL